MFQNTIATHIIMSDMSDILWVSFENFLLIKWVCFLINRKCFENTINVFLSISLCFTTWEMTFNVGVCKTTKVKRGSKSGLYSFPWGFCDANDFQYLDEIGNDRVIGFLIELSWQCPFPIVIFEEPLIWQNLRKI